MSKAICFVLLTRVSGGVFGQPTTLEGFFVNAARIISVRSHSNGSILMGDGLTFVVAGSPAQIVQKIKDSCYE